MPSLYIDTRYKGSHGIGRYATEVVPRIVQSWVPFEPKSSPTAVTGSFSPSRLRLSSDTLLYSPGFGVGISRCRQLPTVYDLTHLRVPTGQRAQLHRVYYDRVLKPLIRRDGHVMTITETSANDIREWLDDDSIAIHNAGALNETVPSCAHQLRKSGQAYDQDCPNFSSSSNIN